MTAVLPPEPQRSSGPGGPQLEDVRSALSLLGLLFVLGFLSWNRTGDPLRDWGRELYTAWRISEGDLIYRDVASLFGPLSQTLNGALFTIVGASQAALTLVNLAILGAASFLVMDLCARMSDRATGWLASFVFLTVFGFGHLTSLGNYNFITPYSHAATHGTVLCIVVVWALTRWLSSGSWSAGLIAGLAAGSTWMTKPEIALASTLALLIGVAFGLRARVIDKRAASRVLAATLVPVTAIGLALAAAIGPPGALNALLTPYLAALAVQPLHQEFYRTAMGLDRVGVLTLGLTGATAAFLTAYLATAKFGGQIPERLRAVIATCIVIATVLTTVATGHWRSWLIFAMALPLACVVGGVLLSSPPGEGRDSAARRASLAAWVTLSAVFLLKLGLRPRFDHYGFYLAVPATLLLLMIAVHYGPVRLARRGWDTSFVRFFSRAWIVGLASVLCLASIGNMSRRSYQLVAGRDRLIVRAPQLDPRTATISRALARLPDLLSAEPNPTLAVLPEGAALNYWLRSTNSVKHPVLLPPELAAFGEDAVLRNFELRPPQLILSLERDMSEYGMESLVLVPGATRLTGWIESNYCEEWSFGPIAGGRQARRGRLLRYTGPRGCSD